MRTFTIVTDQGDISDYVFIYDTSTEVVKGKKVYSNAVSFSTKSKTSYNYPVVFENFITMHNQVLTEIEYNSIPSSFKRKYSEWKNLQTI